MYNNFKSGFHNKLLWKPYLKLFMVETTLKIIMHVLKLLQKFYKLLLQNLMRMEHLQICLLKLIKIINILETNRLNYFKFCILSIFIV